MKSRDDYEFIILPWEYRGADFDPRPDAVIEVVSNFRHDLMLKVKQNYLFFREVGDDPDGTCAVLQPLAKTSKQAEQLKETPQLLGEIFQEARAKGNLARTHYISRQSLGNRHQLATVMGFLCVDGSGVFREFWDDNGIPFQLPQCSLHPNDIWCLTPSVINKYVRKAWNPEFAEALGKREVPPQVLQGEPVRWVRGSKLHLEKLVRWLFHGLLNELKGERFVYHHWGTNPSNPNGRLIFYLPRNGEVSMPASIQRIAALILEENVMVGWRWNASNTPEHGNSTLRRDCDLIPSSYPGEIPPPTAHERLEAKLNLRGWLRGKLPEAEIQRLLS